MKQGVSLSVDDEIGQSRASAEGIGSQLVRRFEEAAAARGCRVFYLDTFSFQARPFYERLGYEARLEIRGFGPGIAKYTGARHALGYLVV